MASGEFLSGDALAARIVSIAEGSRLRCAVAFWTENGVAQLFPDGIPGDAKIICDISMGGTSAEALIALGAPGSKSVKHAYRMHAKVFISDAGMVTASANVTGSALGDDDGNVRNSEAGIFCLASSPTWKTTWAWFDHLFTEASMVGAEELALAAALYRPKPLVRRRRVPRADSLLDLISIAPAKFERVGFVFTGEPTTPEQRKEVRQRTGRMSKDAAKTAKSLPDNGIFYDWFKKDTKRWPAQFVLFWQPSKRLYLSGRRLELRIPDLGAIMSVGDLGGLKDACGVGLPRFKDAERVDADLALRILEYGPLFYANGAELAARIAEIEAEDS